ncbi:hypothetical protein [Burkholderia sp. L27(2015)]|jgi:hypothetical protein|uniref:hypothetical protein n=1 Tax=Burkholderia sp. L27(2015) TaxID=1641858 RepID=UPI00131B7D7C|nr:hypothetical protein [Burkholderia sp. L27(2015)]
MRMLKNHQVTVFKRRPAQCETRNFAPKRPKKRLKATFFGVKELKPALARAARLLSDFMLTEKNN